MANTNRRTARTEVAAIYCICATDSTCDMHDRRVRPSHPLNQALTPWKLRFVRWFIFTAIPMPSAAAMHVMKAH